MTAGQPESPVIEGVRSLEVRWIIPGLLDAAVAGWFARFPAEVEAREDIYLLQPRLRGLSVKVRAGPALEVKVYHGSPGMLQVAGRAWGRLESWQKWSFPGGPHSQASPVPPAGSGCASTGGPAGSRWPAGRPRHPPRSQRVRWSSPKSERAARTGGRWDSKQPARPACSAAGWRQPQRWCSPTPCPAGTNLAWATPAPTPSGSGGGPAPRAAPELGNPGGVPGAAG
jgi:hypothetical protein